MNEPMIWMGWYLLLLGIPLLVTALVMKDWITRLTRHGASINECRRKGA